MTSDTHDFLVRPGYWTPLNRIFSSQFIESEEEKIFTSQRKNYCRPKRSTVKYKKNVYNEKYSTDDSKMLTSDESNSSGDDKHSTVKHKKNTTKKSYSSDEWEIPTHDELDSSENDTSDGSDSSEERKSFDSDYGVAPKKRKKQKSEIHSQTKQSTVKYNKTTTYKSSSSEEWKRYTSDESDSSGDHKELINAKTLRRPQISEYEKMVLKKKEENKAMLAAMKIKEIKEDLKESVKSVIIKKRVSKGKNNKSQKSNAVKELGRFSEEFEERIEIAANKKNEKVCHRQSDCQKDLLKKREEVFTSNPSSKLNESSSVLAFDVTLIMDSAYNDFIHDCSEHKFKIPQLHDNGYVSHFEKMKLQESLIMNITHSVISSMVAHESQEKIIICAGSFAGEIILWHVNSNSEICAFQPHLQSVSCLKFSPYSPNVLVSSSADGTVCHGDFEKTIFDKMFEAESCYHFDFLSPTEYLLSHGDGYVSIVDSRSHIKCQKRHKSNSDIVKTVDLHPVNKNYFVSAHQKGTVKLWDLRKLQDEPVDNVYIDGGNIISSFFSPVTGNSVLVTLSNAICLLDSSSLNKEFQLIKSVEHKNMWESTPFQAKWLPNADDAFVVGSTMNPRRIEIFDNKLCNLFKFTDKYFGHIAPINTFHSSLPFLASASKRNVFIFSERE